MYNRGMKRQSVAVARARSSDPLGAAEKGQPEGMERRRGRRKTSDYVDPRVAEGQGTWEWDPAGLEFREPQPRK